MTRFALLACAAAFVVAGCSTTGGGDTASASSRDWTAPVGKDGNAPFPSTYKPYPGRPTALVGATIYDGRGGRIERRLHPRELFRPRLRKLRFLLRRGLAVLPVHVIGRLLAPRLLRRRQGRSKRRRRSRRREGAKACFSEPHHDALRSQLLRT